MFSLKCHVVYDVVHNQKCHDVYHEECHEEYDVVVDTTYIEECQDIVTQHCQQTSQQVHHSSAVVGHDSQVIHGGHTGAGHAVGHVKRWPSWAMDRWIFLSKRLLPTCIENPLDSY